MRSKRASDVAVLALFAKNTLWKLLLAAGVAAVLQTAFFFLRCRKTIAMNEPDGIYADIRHVVSSRPTIALFLLLFVFAMLLLSLNACDGKSRCGYTLRRIIVSERRIFFMRAGYNTGCIVLVLCRQLLVMLLLCTIYLRLLGIPDGRALLQYTFYKRGLLHSLLPMADIACFVRNLLLVGLLGVTSAAVPVYARRGKRNIAVVFVTVVTGFMMVYNPGYGYADLSVAGAAVLACVVLLPLTLREVRKDA